MSSGTRVGPEALHKPFFTVYEGIIEEENNGHVVFTWNIHGSAGKWVGGGEGGGEALLVSPPHPFL